MPFKLVGVGGNQSFDLRLGAPLVVGRALSSDIPVFDPTISRRHAEVICNDAGVEVRDLGSSNGTFLNGARVDAAHLTLGDVVSFGKVPFRLAEAMPTVERPTPVMPAPSIRVGGTIVRQLNLGESRALAPSEDEKKLAQKLSLLLEVSKGLTRTVDTDALLETIAGFCLQIFDVDYVSILLTDERGENVPKVSRDRHGAAAQRTVPQSIVRTVVQDKVAILSDNAPEDLRFGGQSILMQRVRSTMCAPLANSETRILGVLYVDNVTSTHRFDEEDLDFLIAFASIAAAAIENAQFSLALRQEMAVRSNFERYFAPSLAARIASSSGAIQLGGDKRPIAVLFSDIRGFTTLSESMKPDDMASLLTEYFTEMVDCVFRHNGTLDKFMGDAVMAQWGAPLGGPDDADRAMRAAIDMMRALDALNVKWREQGRPVLGIGIGLNFGEAFAGNIGSERRLEFTVIGDTVNTASRLCAAAESGEILLSDDMRRALQDPTPLDECPPLDLKGKAHPVPVYRVRL
jgi:adenylate cyclase